VHNAGLDSETSTETFYSMGGAGIESWWGGEKFSVSVLTGSVAHPASCAMCNGSLSRK